MHLYSEVNIKLNLMFSLSCKIQNVAPVDGIKVTGKKVTGNKVTEKKVTIIKDQEKTHISVDKM